MDWEKITLLLVGGIVGFLVNVGLMRLKNKDEFRKEQLKNLYYPLNAAIEKKYKTLRLMKSHFSQDFESFSLAYYQFFLALRDIYLDNRVYESKELRAAFHLLDSYHRKEELNFTKWSASEDDILKNLALFELKHQIDEDDLSEIERNIEKVIEVIKNDISKRS